MHNYRGEGGWVHRVIAVDHQCHRVVADWHRDGVADGREVDAHIEHRVRWNSARDRGFPDPRIVNVADWNFSWRIDRLVTGVTRRRVPIIRAGVVRC